MGPVPDGSPREEALLRGVCHACRGYGYPLIYPWKYPCILLKPSAHLKNKIKQMQVKSVLQFHACADGFSFMF